MNNSGIIRRPVIRGSVGCPLVMCVELYDRNEGSSFFYVDRYDFKRIDFTEPQPVEEFIHTMQF